MREVHRIAEGDERRLRQLWRDKQAELAKTREALTVIERQARETEQRLASVAENRSAAEDALIEANERLAEIELALETLDNDDALEVDVAAAETETARHRAGVAEVRQVLARLERDAHVRSGRLNAIGVESERWQSRCDGAAEHVATLGTRMAETETRTCRVCRSPGPDRRAARGTPRADRSRGRGATGSGGSAGRGRHGASREPAGAAGGAGGA